MFGFLQKKTPKVTLQGYEAEQLELKAEEPLKQGPLDVLLQLADSPQPVPVQVEIVSGFDDQKLYWATLAGPADLIARIQALFPEPELPPEEPAFVEKRAIQRLPKVLGIMAKEIPGFKTVTFDLSENGVRIVVPEPLPVGATLIFNLDLDDARIEPMKLQGEILWCAPRPSPGPDGKPVKGHWIGVRLVNVPAKPREILDRYVEEHRKVEHGVITRDYDFG